ncbi:hypothetical protein SS50377_23063 [Spironucleus salmonicida]|uniref:Uncharacterized protein n=1 Tax=Spironucleus salmonicida TaxID=348837 RepID=V6M2Z8_9EUKA|nr:hypothetical protein SS50377_23063 [Spironucleus salmonicida]|eukprot:EST47639.1 hypothetical protein SS50377_12334 [Spironucleus salmonicida]
MPPKPSIIPFGRGGLGPDLNRESTKQAAEKQQRATEYAAAVKEQAKKTLQNAPKAQARPSQREIDQQKAAEKKFRAEEYAKQIKKPKVIVRDEEVVKEYFEPKFERKTKPKSEVDEIRDMLDLHDKYEDEVAAWYD